jgi:hypothetical protein
VAGTAYALLQPPQSFALSFSEQHLPITIYKSDTSERVDWICDDDWELPSQIEQLSVWLKRNCDQLKPANYVADIGFDIRRYAWGGGVVQSVESMRIMSYLGMELFLSEYPDRDGE